MLWNHRVTSDILPESILISPCTVTSQERGLCIIVSISMYNIGQKKKRENDWECHGNTIMFSVIQSYELTLSVELTNHAFASMQW